MVQNRMTASKLLGRLQLLKGQMIMIGVDRSSFVSVEQNQVGFGNAADPRSRY